MKLGFVKVAAVTPKIKVADTRYNGQIIRTYMKEAQKIVRDTISSAHSM